MVVLCPGRKKATRLNAGQEAKVRRAACWNRGKVGKYRHSLCPRRVHQKKGEKRMAGTTKRKRSASENGSAQEAE
jgi:hypothetical protein